MTVHTNGSVSVVTHKLIKFTKICMDAILKTLSKVMNGNRRNKVFIVINYLKMREYTKGTYFSLNYYKHVIFF